MSTSFDPAAACAALQAAGISFDLVDALALTRHMLANNPMNAGLVSRLDEDALTIAKEIVDPSPDMDPGETYYTMVAEALVWRNAHPILDAISSGLGCAMYAEFCGEPVPEESGYNLDSIGARIRAQLRWDSHHIEGQLLQAWETILGDDIALRLPPTGDEG